MVVPHIPQYFVIPDGALEERPRVRLRRPEDKLRTGRSELGREPPGALVRTPDLPACAMTGAQKRTLAATEEGGKLP